MIDSLIDGWIENGKNCHEFFLGFAQGVRRSVSSLSCIMGPLWAGAAFEMVPYAQYYPFFGVPLALLILILVRA